MLKTMIVKAKNSKFSIGVIEDNCSTDSFVTHQKAAQLKLKGIDVNLEIEGINTTETIESKIYVVPILTNLGNVGILNVMVLMKSPELLQHLMMMFMRKFAKISELIPKKSHVQVTLICCCQPRTII